MVLCQIMSIESTRADSYVVAAYQDRRDTIHSYLDGLNEADADMAEHIAGQLLQSGEPLTQTAVIIPVAAAQEANNVTHAISEYARQKPLEPFTLILGLNSPALSSDTDNVQATFAAVEQAKEDYPRMDIRSTYVEYGEPVIGEVRRDLWNGVATASRATGNFDDATEIIGINHDIDLVWMATTSIASIQQYYRRRDSRHIISPINYPVGTRVKHAHSADHPNISRAVFWGDYVQRQAKHPYEAGVVIPMSFYADQGGFDASAKTYEVGKLTRNKHVGRLLPGTDTETSPRRYIDKMNDHGYDIWSDDSFTAEDPCREDQDVPDITRERQHEVVQGNLTYAVACLIDTADDKGVSAFLAENPELVTEPWNDRASIARKLRHYVAVEIGRTAAKAGSVLDKVIGSPVLNNEFDALVTKALAVWER